MRQRIGPRKISRRAFVRVGYLTGLGLSLADHLRLMGTEQLPASATADSVIFVHLAGGPSHLDTLDMKPEAPAEEKGEFQRIDSRIIGVPVCEHLPKLASMLDRFTLLRGISHSAGAHPQADEYLFTGNRPNPSVAFPSLGSVLAKERPVTDELPGFVSIPSSEMSPGFLGMAYSSYKTTAIPVAGKPFEVRGLSLADGFTIPRINRRERLLRDLDTRLRKAEANSSVLEGLDKFAEKANAMILSERARKAFDTHRESESISKLFAANDAGQSLLLAARLVEHGVRFVTVTLGAWDTHLDNFKNLKNQLLPQFDAGITALVQALHDKRLIERTLVIATGEFGRTPKINSNAGRDHWPRTMWTLAAGGGVRSGNLVGATDSKGHGPDDSTHLKPDDLAASIYHALGIDHRLEYITRSGRPAILVAEGKVIREMFA